MDHVYIPPKPTRLDKLYEKIYDTVGPIPEGTLQLTEKAVAVVGSCKVLSAAVEAYFSGNPLKFLGILGGTLALYAATRCAARMSRDWHQKHNPLDLDFWL